MTHAKNHALCSDSRLASLGVILTMAAVAILRSYSLIFVSYLCATVGAVVVIQFVVKTNKDLGTRVHNYYKTRHLLP